MRLFRNKISRLTDRELIDKFRESEDCEYLGELFKRYSALILGVAFKYLKNHSDSQDATLEVFGLMQQSLLKHDVVHIKNWLHTVTRNHCFMRMRQENNPPFVYLSPDHLANISNVKEDNPALYVNANGHSLFGEDVQNAIASLSEEQATCMQLFYYEGKKYREIAELTGYSTKAVKSHIQNGRRNLRNFLDNKE